MKPNPPCVVCTSPYTLHVQDVVGRRSKKKFPQYACLDCRSFMNPSGYREDDFQREADFHELLKSQENHKAILGQLCLEILTKAPGVKTALEIGFGLGYLMSALKDYGVEPYGFDLNPHCVNFAQNHLGLECECGYFDESHTRSYDLIASCMVFEHLEDPRSLFKLMASKLNRDGFIYINVPFIRRNEWRYLWTADENPGPMPDIFNDTDVHITHFSIEGLKMMGMSMGARSAEYWISKDVYHHSPGSYHGVLFQF